MPIGPDIFFMALTYTSKRFPFLWVLTTIVGYALGLTVTFFIGYFTIFS